MQIYKIVERNIGRAGNFRQSQLKQQEWDNKYGAGNWKTGYEINNFFLTREEAIEEIYDPSYFDFLDNNKHLVEQLLNCKGVYNPHALMSNSVDIQAQTIERYMIKRNLQFKGKEFLPIGTYQPKKITHNIETIIKQKGLKVVNNKIQYPQISYILSPFKIPCILNKNMSIEDFWQSGIKCLGVKI